MYWTDGMYSIELNITKKQASIGSHQGQCDEDIAYLRTLRPIARQLERLDPEMVLDALREYGAWDDVELQNHDANLNRLLWVACGDILERVFE